MLAKKPFQKKLTVGLTGGIGSGKSIVSQLFNELGVDIVDADIIARTCVEPGTTALQKIRDHYGPEILSVDGRLDRGKLRRIIFNSPAEKIWLEAILHPEIRQQIILALESSTSLYNIMASPLLLETDQSQLVDRILVIDADEQLQIERAVARDQSDIKDIKDIMATQLSRQERLAMADDVILNNESLESLRAQVKNLHLFYLSLVNES